MQGLRILNNSGTTVLTSTDICWSIIHTAYVPANSNVSGTINDVALFSRFTNTVQPMFSIPDNQITYKATVNVSKSGNSLSYNIITSAIPVLVIILGR